MHLMKEKPQHQEQTTHTKLQALTTYHDVTTSRLEPNPHINITIY